MGVVVLEVEDAVLRAVEFDVEAMTVRDVELTERILLLSKVRFCGDLGNVSKRRYILSSRIGRQISCFGPKFADQRFVALS